MTPKEWETKRLEKHGTSVAIPVGLFWQQTKSGLSSHLMRQTGKDGTEVILWNEINTNGKALESIFERGMRLN